MDLEPLPFTVGLFGKVLDTVHGDAFEVFDFRHNPGKGPGFERRVFESIRFNGLGVPQILSLQHYIFFTEQNAKTPVGAGKQPQHL